MFLTALQYRVTSLAEFADTNSNLASDMYLIMCTELVWMVTCICI